MTRQTITRALLTVLVAVAIGQLVNSSDATAGFPGKGIWKKATSWRRCPACDYQCKLDAKQVDEEIPCFEVESKVICIPRVVFPWQKKKCNSCDACDGRGCTNCVHNGAKTRQICVLKSDSYKCPKCEYTWSAEKKPCCDSGCASPSCDVIERATSTPKADSEPVVIGLKTDDVQAHEIQAVK